MRNSREFSLGWKYPVRCSAVTFQNCERIHPYKQIDVQLLVNMLSKYNCVKKIVVFGSSVSMRCKPWSDVDLYVETGGVSARPMIEESLFSTDIDILTDPLNLDRGVGLAIKREGVAVYERSGY